MWLGAVKSFSPQGRRKLISKLPIRGTDRLSIARYQPLYPKEQFRGVPPFLCPPGTSSRLIAHCTDLLHRFTAVEIDDIILLSFSKERMTACSDWVLRPQKTIFHTVIFFSSCCFNSFLFLVYLLFKLSFTEKTPSVRRHQFCKLFLDFKHPQKRLCGASPSIQQDVWTYSEAYGSIIPFFLYINFAAYRFSVTGILFWAPFTGYAHSGSNTPWTNAVAFCFSESKSLCIVYVSGLWLNMPEFWWLSPCVSADCVSSWGTVIVYVKQSSLHCVCNIMLLALRVRITNLVEFDKIVFWYISKCAVGHAMPNW